MTGEGGAGKIPLAVELARVLVTEGWQALWAPPGKETEAVMSYGWETCRTGGVNENFQVSRYSIT